MIVRVEGTGPESLEVGLKIDFKFWNTELGVFEFKTGIVKMITGMQHRFGEYVLVPESDTNKCFVVEDHKRGMHYIFESSAGIMNCNVSVDNTVAYRCIINRYAWKG